MATAEKSSTSSLAFIDAPASDSQDAQEFLRNVGEDLANAARVLESLKSRSRLDICSPFTVSMPSEPHELELVPCNGNAAASIPDIFIPPSSVLSRQAESTAEEDEYQSTSAPTLVKKQRDGCPRLCEKCRHLGVRLLGGKTVARELSQPPTLVRPSTAIPSSRESKKPSASVQQLARTQSHISQPRDVSSTFEKLQSFRRSLVAGAAAYSSGVTGQQADEVVLRREMPRLQRFSD